MRPPGCSGKSRWKVRDLITKLHETQALMPPFSVSLPPPCDRRLRASTCRVSCSSCQRCVWSACCKMSSMLASHLHAAHSNCFDLLAR
eukprot:2737161-Pyramimonas_sp.AAC.1